MKSIVLWITVLLLVGAPEPIRDGPGDVSDQPIPQTFRTISAKRVRSESPESEGSSSRPSAIRSAQRASWSAV